MKLKIVLLLFLTIFQFELRASCVDALKEVLTSKSITTQDIIKAKAKFQPRLDEFVKNLESAKKKRLIQGSINEIYFNEYMVKVEKNTHRRQIIELVQETYKNNDLIKDWAENLLHAILNEALVRQDAGLLSHIESTGSVSPELMLEVLGKRLEEAGFEKDNIETLTTEVDVEEFGEVLQKRKLIVDQGFATEQHGELIHILQLDLMRYAAKREKIDPRLVGELVEWLGSTQEISLPSGDIFIPAEAGWEILFDSFNENLLSCPEVLNPVIERFFGMR